MVFLLGSVVCDWLVQVCDCCSVRLPNIVSPLELHGQSSGNINPITPEIMGFVLQIENSMCFFFVCEKCAVAQL